VGLVLTSAVELSFSLPGFLAAMLSNAVDCVQNVLSKRLMDFWSPARVQLYTTTIALAIQLLWIDLPTRPAPLPPSPSPASFATPGLIATDLLFNVTAMNCTNSTAVKPREVPPLPVGFLLLLLLNGVASFYQSFSAFMTLSAVGPTNLAVMNTVKRAALIFVSILVFGSRVSLQTVVGLLVLLTGAYWYHTESARATAAPAAKTKCQ
jgi:solute carrier family 35 protein E2